LRYVVFGLVLISATKGTEGAKAEM